MWECTGGSVLKGEDTFQGAIREVKEELGIDISKCPKKLLGTVNRYYKWCTDILDVWLFKANIDIININIQIEEVNDVKWASKEEILDLYNNNKFEANAFFSEIIESNFIDIE